MPGQHQHGQHSASATQASMAQATQLSHTQTNTEPTNQTSEQAYIQIILRSCAGPLENRFQHLTRTLRLEVLSVKSYGIWHRVTLKWGPNFRTRSQIYQQPIFSAVAHGQKRHCPWQRSSNSIHSNVVPCLGLNCVSKLTNLSQPGGGCPSPHRRG